MAMMTIGVGTMHQKANERVAGMKSLIVTDKNSRTHATVRAIIIHFRLNWMRGMAKGSNASAKCKGA